MSTIVLNRGFPDAWRAGQLEQEIYATIKRNVDQRWPNQLNLLINPTFIDLGDSPELLRFCMDQKPDRVFIGSTTDPLTFTGSTIKRFFPDLNSVTRFGYFDTEYQFDFWAVACARYFRSYTETELELVEPKYLFVNYNRKPHQHRQCLARSLVSAELDRAGILTLGRYPNQDYDFEIHRTLSETDDEYKDWGSTDVVGSVGIPNDVYSLGRLDIWQQHLVNIVSETEFAHQDHVFVSEKIYKPIIGMRPFMINSHPRLLDWLEVRGFDTFRDLWPVPLQLGNNTVQSVSDYIVANMQWLNTQNLQELYTQIKPRLLKNREHFFKYADQQEQKIQRLFLN